ncbi:MAG: hypothetical protein H6Q17_1349 [Bacteroidetes bacterium]|jgi:hypothetical protein|nr:hypothetical protein [Bacteroidota bacterium]
MYGDLHIFASICNMLGFLLKQNDIYMRKNMYICIGVIAKRITN